MKAIQMTIDESLLEQLDCAARADHQTRSAFLRWAVEEVLERRRIQEMVRQHEEGYRAAPQTKEELAELSEWASIQAWDDD